MEPMKCEIPPACGGKYKLLINSDFVFKRRLCGDAALLKDALTGDDVISDERMCDCSLEVALLHYEHLRVRYREAE
jgi:hypothetical protein